MTPRGVPSRGFVPGAVVFVGALAMRLVYIGSVWGSPSVRYPMGDALVYHEKALAILAGEWLGDRAFYQDPLYPYFLAALYALFGEGSVLVLCTQALLGAATALLVFRIGCDVFDRRLGLLAGLLAAAYPVSFYYDALLLKVSLSLFLATLALHLVLRADARNTRGSFFGAGFAFGLATLTRGNYLLFLPLLLGWVWLGRGSGARRPLATALVAVGLALAILPVTIRNAFVSRDFVLITSQAGQNFYIGNFRDNRSGSYKAPPFVTAHAHHEEDDFREEGERRAGRELSPSELSRLWLRAGLAEIRADPAHFASHALRKLRLFANDFEVADNHSFDYFREELSFVLRLPLPGWGVVLPLALCGMVFARRDRRALLLALYFAVYAASLALFFTTSRYRMPVVPVALVFAAHGASEIVALLRARRFAAVAPAAIFLALAWPFAYQHVAGVDLSLYRTNLGVQHARRARAARVLATELEAAGDLEGARAALARDEELSGFAETEFHRALDARPQNRHYQQAFAHHMVSRVDELDRLGEHERALEAAQSLAETLPDLPEGKALLGAMYARVGREGLASSILRGVLTTNPGNRRARRELARLRGAREGPP